jgi:hypothetical protein
MKRVFFTPPVIKFLIVIAAIGGFVLLAYSLAGLPAPREANRVSAPDGTFSIIMPPDWEDKISAGTDGMIAIKMSPLRWSGRMTQFTARRLVSPPVLTEAVAIKFQNRDAWILAKQRSFEYVWQILFQRDGTWFVIVLNLPRADDVPNSDWWPYVMSFKSSKASPSRPPAPEFPGATTIPAAAGSAP